MKVLGLLPSFYTSGQLGANLCNFLVKLKSKCLCQAKIYLKTGLVSCYVLFSYFYNMLAVFGDIFVKPILALGPLWIPGYIK